MARRRSAQKREILPDPKYHDKLVTKFINNLMLDGKKSLAERIFYGSMDLIQSRESEDALVLFKKAVENAKPVLEVKSRRVGGATPPAAVTHGKNKGRFGARWRHAVAHRGRDARATKKARIVRRASRPPLVRWGDGGGLKLTCSKFYRRTPSLSNQ